jgi:hypothetical protein
MLTDMKKYTWLGLVAAAFGLGALGAWVVRPQPTSSQTIYAALPPPQVCGCRCPRCPPVRQLYRQHKKHFSHKL